MAKARGHEQKTKLEPVEKLICAYFHLVRGIAQQDLADLFRVNSGRVNEAISDLRTALQWKGDEKRAAE